MNCTSSLQEGIARYQFKPTLVPVQVEDHIDASPRDHTYLLEYKALVYIAHDELEREWNLQVDNLQVASNL